MAIPKIGSYYQHRYGGLYKVTGISLSTVDKSKWVVYEHQFPFEQQIWHRPYDEWCEEGKFEKITRSVFNEMLNSDPGLLKEAIARAKISAQEAKDK